jgi:hypothetical protein
MMKIIFDHQILNISNKYLLFFQSEDKIQPVKDLTGPLTALQHAARQDYFSKSLATYFIVFISR